MLADKVADVELAIASDRYAEEALDEHLIRRLHHDIAADLLPHLGGRWRQIDVQVGSHEPPAFPRVPELMHSYALDLQARLHGIALDDDSRLLETLAFAEGQLLSIHPFADFNGRVTRVFLSELLRRLNLPAIDPTPESGAPTRRYLAALDAADARHWAPLEAIWRERFEANAFLERHFTHLTGHPPMRWQARLFRQHFLHGELPAAISVPTGLGKTAVMALWLIALAWQMQCAGALTLPRRLVYVVDRRAVVDQATEFAEKLRDQLASAQATELRAALGLGERRLPISTLRGQFVDNRQWLEDPACPAIVIGTLDMVGSRLLFEGYGVSRKMRPYQAGLLGADALVMLDEAHLVPPFESLLASIEAGADAYAATDPALRALVPPFKLLSLSATGRQRPGAVFALDGDAAQAAGQRGDLEDALTTQRLGAQKSLTFEPTKAAELGQALADQAWQLCVEGRSPVRCVVFCNSRSVATKCHALIVKKLGKDSQDAAELLVGARRVLEREQARQRLADLGFLPDKSVPRNRPVFLVATSAGEVGVDLDADHMVCDLVEWERMVQRLGRVNRRGEGQAQVRVVLPDVAESTFAADDAAPIKEDGKGSSEKAAKKKEEQARQAERVVAMKAAVRCLPQAADGTHDASPGAIWQLHALAAVDAKLQHTLTAASPAPPLRPALTRAVVDAWSMTSLDKHTGRPDIQPWLRGWVDDEPQTTLIWRTHLPVPPHADKVSAADVEDFFEAAPPHASEQLEAESHVVMDWLKKRCAAVLKLPQATAPEGSVALRANDVLGLVLSGAGELRAELRLSEFADDGVKKRVDELRRTARSGDVWVLDARIGGLASGLLSDTSTAPPATADGVTAWGPADGAEPLVRFRVRLRESDGASTDGPGDDAPWRERHRWVRQRNAEGQAVEWLSVDKWRGDSSNESDRAIANWPQLLGEHQQWAEQQARTLTQRLGLAAPWSDALAMAARLHDEGKKALNWQRAFKAPPGPLPYAKTKGPINQNLLGHYRHEFGSLPYVEGDEAFRLLPGDMQDLVLHLVAAHHGKARPVIDVRGCEDAPPEALTARARAVALRFARLQQRWGPWGLAWWEALLRAADQQASRLNDEKKAGR